MASPSLVLPGVLFVGEDERARTVAVTGAAAGWMKPKGLLEWSNEVSVVLRASLTEEVKRDTKAVTPEEQIPPARMPLTLQAAQKAPLIAVAQKLVPKLVEKGVRVHTIGVDRITSSFYYLAEGGGEDPIRAEGDLVAAVGAMLGERADNAAIERSMDGLVDRLLRSLSQDRVNELAVELAAALPRAANDGTGLKDLDLEMFERQLSQLVGSSEKYKGSVQQIADALTTTTEQRVDVPLFGDGRKVSQAPFELTLGERAVSLPTYDRWVLTGPFKEPAPAPKPAPQPIKTEPPKAEPIKTEPPKVEPIKTEPPKVHVPSPKPAVVAVATPPKTAEASPKPADAIPRPGPPRPTSSPAKEELKSDFAKPEEREQEKKPAEEPKTVEVEAKQEKPAEAREPAREEEKAPSAPDDEPKVKRENKTEKVEKKSEKKAAKKPEKKKGEFPWLAVILLLVFGVIAWQYWLKQ